MRATVRTVSLALVLLFGALYAPTAAKKPRPRPQCATNPREWTVIAKNGQWVVVQPYQYGGMPLVWRYCSRKTGVFRRLAYATNNGGYTSDPNGPPNGLSPLNPPLAGDSVAYIGDWSDRYGTLIFRVVVKNLRSGVRSITDVGVSLNTGYCLEEPHPLLLAPTGVAAWQVNYRGCGGAPSTSTAIQTLNTRTGRATTLDTANVGELANLQLYRCAAGCPANATVAAWTHDGSWRYARVG